jgi:GTP-binding protein HflX
LEEVIEADMIMHVRDMVHEDAEAQARDVEHVLKQLGIEGTQTCHVIEVWNKIDQLSAEDLGSLRNVTSRYPAEQRPVLVSALTGEGTDQLVREIEQVLARLRLTLTIDLEPADGAGLSWLHRHGEVIAKQSLDDGRLAVTVRADPANAERLRARFSRAGAPARD